MNLETSRGNVGGGSDERGPLDDFEMVDRREASLPQDELDRIVKWLDPTAYLSDSGEFKRHLAAQVHGTGVWLTQTERYQTWLESDSHPSLWIKGVPGAGKSVMAASIVQHLQQTSEPGTPVLFFFFRHIVQANQTPRALVRDLLAQALPHSLPLQAALKATVDSTPKHDKISDNALWECLLQGLASPLSRRVYCVIDALDEMDAQEDDAFFSSVNNLASLCPKTVKLMITSRPKRYLQSQLRASSIVHLSLDEERIHHDIRTFVGQKLRHALSGQTPDQMDSLVDKISRRSAGLFLYARLLVDQILSTLERGQAVDIDKMPIGLQDMYNRVLFQQSREPGIDTELQAFLLGCVTHSFRPLRLLELAALLQKYMRKTHDRSVSLSDAKLFVRQACGPLLDILDDETVQVLHHSLTEFLLDASARATVVQASNPLKPFPLLNPDLAHKNLAMMSMWVLDHGWKEGWNRHQDPSRHPFESYAEEFWVKHLKHISSLQDPDLFDCFNSFCRSRDDWHGGPLRDWVNEVTERGHLRCASSVCLSPLFLAAYIGHIEWCKSLISSGCRTRPDTQPSAPQSDHQWPCFAIWWAILGGSLEVVEYLLPLTETSDIKRNENGEYCWTDDLIELAISRGQLDILKRLLKAGHGPLGFMWKRNVAETEITSKQRPERLRYAMRQYRDVRCLAATLPYLGKDLQDQLLCIFAEQGNADAVECILEDSEANPNASFSGKTALYGACQSLRLSKARESSDNSRGYETVLSLDSIRCVELLLARGASVQGLTTVRMVKQSAYSDISDLFEEKGRTPLHGLMGSWYDGNSTICEKIFDNLMDAGADLEARDGLGDTPVFCLFPTAHAQAEVERPLRFLLERGADASVLDAQGRTLLHRALMYHRNPRLVQMLVDHGVDVNALATDTRSRGEKKNLPAIGLIFRDPAWYHVLHQGRYEEKANRKDKVKDWEPENKAMVKILVGAGASIDAGGSDATLLEALPFCDVEILKLILGSRKHPETVEKVLFGLQQAYTDLKSTGGRPLTELVSMLVAAGGSLEARVGWKHRTPLLMAVNDMEMFQALLSAGADRTATDSDGNGVLHIFVGATADFQRIALDPTKLKTLVGLGFDPHGVNEHGDTLLHMAVHLQDAREFDKKPPALIPMLTALVEYGISPNSRNSAGMTPIHAFLRHLAGGAAGFRFNNPSQKLDRLLQFFKASVTDLDIDIPDNEGLTPFHYAAMSMSSDSVQCLDSLLSFGASITATDKSGRNAIHLSCIARNTSSILFLLDHAPNDLLHAPDSLGRTPLFYACTSGLVEAVGALLDAGANVNARDFENQSPLHACAIFPAEQANWDRVEHLEITEDNTPARQLHTDIYRPYYVELPYGTDERRRPDGSLPELRFGLMGKTVADFRVFHAPWLEAPGEAIYSVVRKLVSAGAVADDTMYTAARNSQCGPMLVALMDTGPSTEIEETQRSSLWPGVVEDAISGREKEEEQQLLKNPVMFMKEMSVRDVDWLLENHANLSTPFRVIPFEPNWNMKTSPVGGDFTPHPQPSFVQTAVLSGLVSFVERLGPLARCHDSSDNIVDEWAVRMTAPFQVNHFKIAPTWTLGDLVKSPVFGRRIQPLVYQACIRRYPNLEMLKVLVERCGADPNAREMRVNYFTGNRREMSALTALGYMALEQDYWHLSAIRYLVGHGADVNIRDLDGETPLIIACNPSLGGRWRRQFIELLLELGADPNLASEKGTTCLDLVADPDIVDLLVRAGASPEALRQGLVHKAIQAMDVELMKYAASYGADFNLPLDGKKHPWKNAESFARNGYPLVGAFVENSRRGIKNEGDTPEQARKRIAMVRYLLQNGADPFVNLPSENRRDASEPFLHSVLRRGGFDEGLINVFFEPAYAERLDWETRDGRGRTPLLASCAAKSGWNVNFLPKVDSTAFHARLLKLGADITATDDEGMNIFHIMLLNQDMPSSRILSLLSDPPSPEILSLALQSTKSTPLPIHRPGDKPLDFAFSSLRPAVALRLLDLGAFRPPAVPRPGSHLSEISPTHHILSQCFDIYLRPIDNLTLCPGGWGLGESTAPDHTVQCLALRERLIACDGWEPTAVDHTGTPAWFVFVLNREAVHMSHHEVRWRELVPQGNSRLSELPDSEEQCRTIRFWDAFLGDKLDLQTRNTKTGETVLHALAGSPVKKGDREVFEWLVKKGLDPLAEDNKGRSSLDVAAETGKQEILDLFRN
ncbi:ankyrin [Thozetella sp. PMI_491]|nr:ankyrin [Thozetella sp. PMI_491]